MCNCFRHTPVTICIRCGYIFFRIVVWNASRLKNATPAGKRRPNARKNYPQHSVKTLTVFFLYCLIRRNAFRPFSLASSFSSPLLRDGSPTVVMLAPVPLLPPHRVTDAIIGEGKPSACTHGYNIPFNRAPSTPLERERSRNVRRLLRAAVQIPVCPPKTRAFP